MKNLENIKNDIKKYNTVRKMDIFEILDYMDYLEKRIEKMEKKIKTNGISYLNFEGKNEG